jgi:aspartyl-tRNA synthetase
MRVYSGEIVKYEGKEVELAGWVHARRDHGKLVFIDLRDRSGLAQVVFGPEIKEAGNLRSEYVIRVRGEVKKRPPEMVNEKLPTGNFEVKAGRLEIINAAAALPISVDTDGYEINEEMRLRYRYLDLRRERLKENLIARHKITKFIRDFLSDRGFIEVETPILSKSTPEGARDYLVPSRIWKGKFYALPQSPQQYKQLLMVAGLEKYFQLPRCFRDEDTRGDRQPEFTQLDIEMSFATQEDILNLTEELYKALIEKLFPEKKISTLDAQGKFPRLKYNEVMAKYGSDRPDLRKNNEDVNELAFAFVTDFPMFEKKVDGSLGAAHHPFTLPTTDTSLDPVRFQHADYPEYGEIMKALDSEEESLKLSAYQYDLVCNGYEIGGGSIRIYNKDLLAKVFERLGNKPEDIKKQFGHMLEAFTYGVPQHGGIACGLDRLIAVLQDEPNIREVIPFPKTGEGYDPMMNSPSEVDKKQLDELGIEIKKKK